MTASATTTLPAGSIADTIVRLGGGGPRRIAESAAGVVVDRGEGCLLLDTNGRRYLDFATAMGVAAVGHAHPHWTAEIGGQAGRLAACVLHTREHAAYLTRLQSILPRGLDRVALYSGGAEAVEVAVRLAQSYTGHRNIISFTTAFHGKTVGVRFTGRRFAGERVALGVDWVHDVPYPLCTGHDAVSYGGCDEAGWESLEALMECARGLDGVAAVMVEPVLGTAGNRPAARRFFAGLEEICRTHHWPLLVDESITGFGRLGTMFASEYFGITPDIMVLGKAMGGGYPLSGVAAAGPIWDGSLYAERSATSSSYGANPLACVAGTATLDIVQAAGFAENVRTVGRRLAEGLRDLAARSPYVAHPRGVGMMLGFDFVDPATGDPAGADLCVQLFRACLDEGLLIVGDVPGVRLNPPLVLSAAEADQALGALDRALCHFG